MPLRLVFNIIMHFLQNYVSQGSRHRDMDNLLLHALNSTVSLAVDQAEAMDEDPFS